MLDPPIGGRYGHRAQNEYRGLEEKQYTQWRKNILQSQYVLNILKYRDIIVSQYSQHHHRFQKGNLYAVNCKRREAYEGDQQKALR